MDESVQIGLVTYIIKRFCCENSFRLRIFRSLTYTGKTSVSEGYQAKLGIIFLFNELKIIVCNDACICVLNSNQNDVNTLYLL